MRQDLEYNFMTKLNAKIFLKSIRKVIETTTFRRLIYEMLFIKDIKTTYNTQTDSSH